MKHAGPIITLAAGATLAGVLFALNINANDKAVNTADTAQTTAPAQVATVPPTTPPTTIAATPSASQTVAVQQVRATYAGHLEAGGSLALAIRNGVAIAYFCDSKRGIEAWYKGTASAGKLEMTTSNGKLTATYTPKWAKGSLYTGNAKRTFYINTVKKPSGLYRFSAQVRGAKIDAGWIVLADGTQVGLYSVDDGDPEQVPPIDPNTATANLDGSPVTADSIDGSTGSGF